MKYKLSDICDVKVGFPFKSELFNENRDGIRLVRGMNVSCAGFRWGNQTRWWNYYTKDLEKYLLKEEDVLIAMDGNVSTNFVQVTKDDLPLLLVQRVARLRAKNVPQKIVWYIVKSHEFGAYLDSVKTGTTISHISAKQIGDYEIDLPDYLTQEKISSILSILDDKIRLNNKINNNLEQQVSVLYHSWFEDFEITNGICPDNWKYQERSSIADITSGKRPPIKSDICNQETPVAIVGAASVMGFTSEANHKDKILVTGRVGTHGIIQRFSTPCWTSDNTLVITSPFYEFANQILHRIDYSSMNRGSTQPLITQGDMKKVVVLVPDEETLAKFEALAGSLMAQWEANNNENVKLASLRDTLLPKLMSGELDVSDIEI